MAENSAYSTSVNLFVSSYGYSLFFTLFYFSPLKRHSLGIVVTSPCVGSLIIKKKAKATGAKTHLICSGSRRIAGYFGYFEYNV